MGGLAQDRFAARTHPKLKLGWVYEFVEEGLKIISYFIYQQYPV
jgi:hypothetical protein